MWFYAHGISCSCSLICLTSKFKLFLMLCWVCFIGFYMEAVAIYVLFICTGHLSVFTYIMTLCGFMHMAYHVAVALFV